MNSKERKLLFVIFGIALLIRLFAINMPILEGTASRQIQTASIARYFFKYGFDILRTRLDYIAGSGGYLVLEFPLYNVILAALYKLAGGAHEWLGRLLSIIFFMGAGFFIFLIIKRIFAYRAAIIGLVVYLFSPLGIIFSRTVMPDSEMLFFSIGAIFFMLYFIEKGKRWSFWASAIFATISLLVKIQSFYILFVLFYLVFHKQRERCFADYKNYLFFSLIIIPAVSWYLYGAAAHRVLSPERMANYNFSNWLNPRLFLSTIFYRDIVDISTGVLLTPVGFALFILGLTMGERNKYERLCFVWLAALFVYAFMFNALLWEPYYYLSFLPIASIFIARVSMLRVQGITQKNSISMVIGRAVAACVIILLIVRYAAFAYVVPAGYKYIPEAAEAMRHVSQPDDLVVVGDQSGASALLYYCDRKGWFLSSTEEDEAGRAQQIINGLEEFRGKGALYFLSADGGPYSYPIGRKFLEKKYTLLKYVEKKYFIYKLSK